MIVWLLPDVQCNIRFRLRMQQEKTHYWRLWHQEERYGILFTTHRKRAEYKTCYHGSQATAGLPYWRIYCWIPKIWRVLKTFGYKYFGLAIWRIFGNFLKAFGYKFFGLAKYTNVSFSVNYSLKMCSSVILCTPCILACIWLQFRCRVIISELADGLKIRDINWKCDCFASRSIVVNNSYKMYLQNVETDYLEIFLKCWKPICFLIKYKAKDKGAVNDWFPVKKLMFC